MEALQNQVFTTRLSGDVIVLQEGARSVYLVNRGGGVATYTGDKSNETDPSTPVELGVAESFEFGDTGQGYKEITIDATATDVDITAIY